MKELLTVKETAHLLKLKETTILRWLKSGKLKGFKLSRRAWRVREEDLKGLLK